MARRNNTQLLSPQGYNIQKDPLNKNPFWEHEAPPYEDVDDELSTTSENPVQNKVITNAIIDLTAEVDNKQDRLTFDTTPIYNSSNPVTSSGIRGADVYTLNQAKEYADSLQKTITAGTPLAVEEVGNTIILTAQLDLEPAEGGDGLLQSGVIWEALQEKQDKLTFDTTPTYNSTNPVTSSGIRGADVYHLNLAKAYTDEKLAEVGYKFVKKVTMLSDEINNPGGYFSVYSVNPVTVNLENGDYVFNIIGYFQGAEYMEAGIGFSFPVRWNVSDDVINQYYIKREHMFTTYVQGGVRDGQQLLFYSDEVGASSSELDVIRIGQQLKLGQLQVKAGIDSINRPHRLAFDVYVYKI